MDFLKCSSCCSDRNQNQQNSRRKFRCCDAAFSRRMRSVVEDLGIDDQKKNMIKKVYIHNVNKYTEKFKYVNAGYSIAKIVIDLGSLIIPSLLMISDSDSTAQWVDEIYWATFFTSLMVGASTAMMRLFKWDTLYYMYGMLISRLESEGYNYLALAGPYRKFNEVTDQKTNSDESSGGGHHVAYTYFLEQINDILKDNAENVFKKMQTVTSDQDEHYVVNVAGHSTRETKVTTLKN